MATQSTALPDEFVDGAFLHEVQSQAEYCLAAALAVGPSIDGELVDDTFRALHGVLTHAGNISKILWPSPTKDPVQAARMSARALRLQAKLDLDPDTSAIIKSRTLRNHLEHFDERLDSWAASGPQGLLDRAIGPSEVLASFPKGSHLRFYDPGRRTFTFANEAFDIARLVQAVSDVRAKASAARTG